MISYTQRAFCSLLSVAGAFALVLASDPAVAAIPDNGAAEGDARTAVVATDDLNLSHPAGVATFERRVAAAAQSVCSTSDRYLTSAESACRARAAEQARRDAGLLSD